MIFSKIGAWFWDVIWPPATQDAAETKLDDTQAQLQTNKKRVGSSLDAQTPQTDPQYSDTKPQIDLEPSKCPEESQSTQISPLSHDPYLHLPVIGIGMTGLVLEMGKDRVVKIPKRYKPEHYHDREEMEYINEINRQTLQNEILVFERLGNYKGIIPCFKTSQYGIELARAQGDLESHLESTPEPEDLLKVDWMLSLVETFSHVHSCRVFVDDIALRNILIRDGQLQLADFGQSILLPLDIDIASANNNDLNVQIEILHFGWILYSLASWKVHKYYFFNPENPDLCWPKPDSFPSVGDVLWGRIILKCWHGEYASMDHVKDEAHQLLTKLHLKSAADLISRPLPPLLRFEGATEPSVSAERVSAELLHPWPNFPERVREVLQSVDLSGQVDSINAAEREFFSVGSELGLTGRVAQNLCVPVAKALAVAHLPNLRFGDAQAILQTQGLPDIIGFLSRDVSRGQDEPLLILAMELKTDWMFPLESFPVTLPIDRRRSLENHVGQIVMYMRLNGLRYGVLSTYQSTVFIHRVSDYHFELSLPVKRGATRPSVRECLFALCAMAASDTSYVEGPDFDPMRLRQPALPFLQASTSPLTAYGVSQEAARSTPIASTNITSQTILFGEGDASLGYVNCTRLLKGKSGVKATFEVDYEGQKAIAKCWGKELYESYAIETAVYEKLHEMHPEGYDVFASLLAYGDIICSSLFPSGYILLLTKREGEQVSQIWDQLELVDKNRIRGQCRRAVSFLRRIPVYSGDAGKHNLLYSASSKTVTMLDFEAVGIPTPAEVAILDAPELFMIFLVSEFSSHSQE
ncbi:hypothetical protein FQN50_004056 [Emmonsiellopsis sp. PD_5]|nr:hypothetical protein FQN50_004056 [Emmonsiellopsis sp. PD_5]